MIRSTICAAVLALPLAANATKMTPPPPEPAPNFKSDRKALVIAAAVGVIAWREFQIKAEPKGVAVAYKMEF